MLSGLLSISLRETVLCVANVVDPTYEIPVAGRVAVREVPGVVGPPSDVAVGPLVLGEGPDVALRVTYATATVRHPRAPAGRPVLHIHTDGTPRVAVGLVAGVVGLPTGPDALGEGDVAHAVPVVGQAVEAPPHDAAVHGAKAKVAPSRQVQVFSSARRLADVGVARLP